MGFALVLVGLLMVITGGRGTYAQFGSLVAGEFSGPFFPPKGQGSTNFASWFIALGTVGALGYISSLQTISRYLMALILLSIVLSHKGFFAQFQAALTAGPKTPNAPPAQQSVSSSSSTATINNAITSNQQGVGGSTPTSAGQAKFNGWINYFLGLGTNSAGATQ